MKKVYLTLFILITLFIFNTKASAITCKYKYNNYQAKISFDKSDTKEPSVSLYGSDFDDEISLKNEFNNGKIKNWKNSYKDTGSGITNFVVTGVCPDYLVLYISKTGSKGMYAMSKFNISIIKNDLSGNAKKYLELNLIDNDQSNSDMPEDTPSSCLAFKEKDCTTNKYFSCLWIEKGEYKYCSSNNLLYVTCGDIKDIPEQVPRIMSFIINLLKIVVPILLVLVSIINILKALASSKEDEIKKAQSTLIKKIIAAVMAFLVVSIVQFVINKVADSDEEKGNIASCLDCFLNNNCSSNIYYKNNVAGTDYCAYLGENKAYNCNNNGDSLTIGDWGKNKIKHRTTGEQE